MPKYLDYHGLETLTNDIDATYVKQSQKGAAGGVASLNNNGKIPTSQLPDLNTIPSGGTAGQVLAKATGTDYDVEWVDQSGGGGGGTTDYANLSNKPKINGVTLSGEKSLADLGIAAASAIPDITGKLDKPATAGTSGQVLTSDGNGGQSWVTPSGGGTTDYADLTNKPSINSVTLSGNKTLDDLGVAAKDDVPQILHLRTTNGLYDMGTTMVYYEYSSETEETITKTYERYGIKINRPEDFEPKDGDIVVIEFFNAVMQPYVYTTGIDGITVELWLKGVGGTPVIGNIESNDLVYYIKTDEFTTRPSSKAGENIFEKQTAFAFRFETSSGPGLDLLPISYSNDDIRHLIMQQAAEPTYDSTKLWFPSAVETELELATYEDINNIILQQASEPSSEVNKIWFPNSSETETELPTYSEFSALKNGSAISPLQFGAAGDGTTDDTEILSTTLNRSNAVIDGQNKSFKMGEIVLTERQNLVIQNFRFYHGISITLKHCENITFRNCIWDEFQDGGVSGKTVQCVIMTTMHTGSSEWVETNNWRMDEVCKGITFENCQFLGTHFTESTPSLYDGTKPHYNTGMCLRLEGVDGLRVLGCYFTQNRGNACIQQNCYAPLGDYEIRNNFFYLNCYGGIELYRYTGMSSYPTRIIQGNRFIGHGLGYLPWTYLETFPEKERGVGTAVLLGGHAGRIQNEVAYCSVCDNHFEDNNESSIEGWQWNPVRNNTILGNGVLQSSESVTEMTQKYKITYQLYVRKNPSQNPLYIGQYQDEQRYPDGEARIIENNTIGRMYGTFNPIVVRGYFYEQFIIRGNTITDAELYENENAKYMHFLTCVFKNGLVWEDNIGMKPYFNECTFEDGEFRLDELQDIYKATLTSQRFESVSKIDRFQQVRSARFSPEYATMRSNDVSTIVNGKPTLGYYKHPVGVVIPTADWDIKDENEYTENGYVFGGKDDPTVLDTGMELGATDQNWTVFVDTTTTSDNSAGNNTYLIKLLTFSDASGNLSLEFGSRYTNQVWTWIFPNAVWNYDTAYQIDGSSSRSFLAPGNTSRFVLRHKAGSGKIEVFAFRIGSTVLEFDAIKFGEYAFTSGTAGTLRFGGVPNSNREASYYNGTIKDARVFEKALSDAQISLLMLGADITPSNTPVPVYDISDEDDYVEGTGLVMDGTYGIDTQIPLLENTNDFTIVARFKFDKMRGEHGQPNFTFFPVFSAMSADMAPQIHTGYTDKGFDVGLSMQDGRDPSTLAVGGFIGFRRDWRYDNFVFIDAHNYASYQDVYYTVIIQRKDDVITLYDNNLVELKRLTGAYATSIVEGNLTIGARMGYDSNYTEFFKGVITDFRVYDSAIDMGYVEHEFPSINDNDVSDKGAVTYHLSNKSNTRKSVRYALVEINYDLGDFNSAEYTVQYPKAFAVRLDQIYDDLVWVPCSSSKRITFTKLCKWDAVCTPFADWNIEIINPGTVPGMVVTITGVKVLLLSKQEAVATTTDATEFNISWEQDLSSVSVGDEIIGYTQYIPEEADSGLTLTAVSDDPTVATVSVSGQDVIVTGVAAGETVIHVSIPYGTEHAYNVTVAAQGGE